MRRPFPAQCWQSILQRQLPQERGAVSLRGRSAHCCRTALSMDCSVHGLWCTVLCMLLHVLCVMCSMCVLGAGCWVLGACALYIQAPVTTMCIVNPQATPSTPTCRLVFDGTLAPVSGGPGAAEAMEAALYAQQVAAATAAAEEETAWVINTGLEQMWLVDRAMLTLAAQFTTTLGDGVPPELPPPPPPVDLVVHQ